jgi:hypothetical protein
MWRAPGGRGLVGHGAVRSRVRFAAGESALLDRVHKARHMVYHFRRPHNVTVQPSAPACASRAESGRRTRTCFRERLVWGHTCGMPRRVVIVFLSLGLLSGCGSGSALSQSVIDQARRQGAALDLMYVVDLPGYELAEQSVGVVGEEGFGAFYSSPGGRQVEMRIDCGPYKCTGTCERDGNGWYTVQDGRQEYVAVRERHHLRLISDVGQVDRRVLKEAAEGARPVVGDGGTPAPPPSPVERGDLPKNGDGAPVQSTGPGG